MAIKSIDSTVSGACFCFSDILSPTTSASSIRIWSVINLTTSLSFTFDTVTVFSVYPMNEILRFTGSDATSNLKRPSKSVVVPFPVALLMTLDDYIKYRFGALPKVKTGFVPLQSVPYVRETPDIPSLSNSKNMGNGGTIDHKTKMERIEVSKQYSIVPAYNKGPYMVVSKEDLKTAGRKV